MSDTIGQSGLADRLIADMPDNRWQAGDKVLTESYVEQHAELRTNDSLLSQLILAEFQLHHDAGEQPDPAGYIQRFPQSADWLLNFLRSNTDDKATSSPGQGIDLTQIAGPPSLPSKTTCSFRNYRLACWEFRHDAALSVWLRSEVSEATTCWKRSPAAGWGSFTRRDRSGRIAQSPSK